MKVISEEEAMQGLKEKGSYFNEINAILECFRKFEGAPLILALEAVLIEMEENILETHGIDLEQKTWGDDWNDN